MPEPANKGKQLPGEVLSAAEIRSIMRACGRGPSGVRNAALVATLYGAALRVSEALALFPGDLDLRHGFVTVKRGKGGKPRTVALDPDAQAHLERWLTVRSTLGLNGRQPVFCTITQTDPEKFGRPIDTSYVRHLLPRLAKRAGIERRVHSHAFRHSYASALAHDGVALPTITAQLGHASTAVTDTYLRKIAPTELLEAVRSRGRLDA